MSEDGPGAGWINNDLTVLLGPRYIDIEEFKRARYANALRNGPNPPPYRNEHYVHLLDGGLADNQGVHSLTETLVSSHSPAEILRAISDGQAKRIVVISVNARSDTASGVGRDAAVPGLLEVLSTVIGAPIDATTALANASLEELVKTLSAAGPAATAAPGHPLFAGLRVYGIAIDFDQFLPSQVALQTEMKNVGTSWTLTPVALRDVIDAGGLLLRQHPCYQRLLLDISATSPAIDPAFAHKYCPFGGE